MENINQEREKIISVDDLGMYIATLISYRSKDPHTQVGACIIDKENNVLSMGYNDPPKYWYAMAFPWRGDVDKVGIENTKYPYIIHAEANAINNYQGPKEKLKNSTIYVTLFPCTECAKQIIQAGIGRVIYKEDPYNNTNDNICAKILFKYCGIEVIDIKELSKISNHDIKYKIKK